ncbi:MAG: hypothetical protein H0X17_22400, partial [Deltaproteobacteria bacterium]|nr:hypothetical protein [Deltaproteobacteria bacterium]
MHRLLLVCVAACGSGKTEPPAAGSSAPGSAAALATGSSAGRIPSTGSGAGGVGDVTCTPLAFAQTSPVPEASGAAWLAIAGAPALVVISDSGNGGAYAVVDPETGETREEGKLPLGGDGEDLEGVAVRGGLLHVVTSPGWVRAYRRIDRGFELADGPYPL